MMGFITATNMSAKMMSNSIDTEVLEEVVTDTKKERQKNIVVYNDDVNTFDWVIETFINVLKHDSMQAEQCASIIHYNGKCAVKQGSYDDLHPLCMELLDRKLSATIE